MQRLTGHYRADAGRAIEQAYYCGDDYVDYEAQSAGEHATVVRLLREFDARRPGSGVRVRDRRTLAALGASKYDAFGVDVSAWAIEQAVQARRRRSRVSAAMPNAIRYRRRYVLVRRSAPLSCGRCSSTFVSRFE